VHRVHGFDQHSALAWNPGMEIADAEIREKIREITFELIGKGEGI